MSSGSQRVAPERLLEVVRLDLRATLEVADVHAHARPDEPLERQLVDRARALALAGREVVPRRVDVGARVGDRRDGVVGPALAVREVRHLAAEDLRHQLRGLGVRLVRDLRAKGLARVLLEPDGEVDDLMAPPARGSARPGARAATSRIQRRSSSARRSGSAPAAPAGA